MVDPDYQEVVIDTGSGYTKCGFGGDIEPRTVFETVVGRPKNPGFVQMDAKDCFVGEEAIQKSGILKLKHPVEFGLVSNWNDLEKILHHAFYEELRVTPEEHPVLMTAYVGCPTRDRAKLVSTMIETFNVPGIFVAIHEVLSLYASGRSTGVVLESGDGLTSVVPVYNGCAIHHSITKLNLGGRQIDEFIWEKLYERRKNNWTNGVFTTIEGEDMGLVVEEGNLEDGGRLHVISRKNTYVEYELPDESKIIINDKDRTQATEILFEPSLIGTEGDGIHEMLVNSIQHKRLDYELRKYMFKTIVLSGGSTLFDGIVERLEKEVRSIGPFNTTLRILAPDGRKFGAWVGGSIVTTLSSMKNEWIERDEYDEYGDTIVHRKCFTGGCVPGFMEKVIIDLTEDDLKERILYCCENVNVVTISGFFDLSISKCFLLL